MSDPRTPFEKSHGLIDYPFPIEQDGEVLIASLLLPERLKREDAERLAAFIESLVKP